MSGCGELVESAQNLIVSGKESLLATVEIQETENIAREFCIIAERKVFAAFERSVFGGSSLGNFILGNGNGERSGLSVGRE